MNKGIIFGLIFIYSFNLKAEGKKKIALLSQWHLLTKQDTKDINESKKLPQFQNQLSIYLVIKEWVLGGRVQEVIAEGCEGEIDKNTNLNFNGWSYWKLYGRKDKSDYQDIMTHVPLKIEAQFQDKVLTTCGDSLELIKKHQMILSDMTGVTGFLFRLEEARDKLDKKKFKLYHEAYEKIAKQKIDNPIKFLKEKLEKLTKEEVEIVKERNQKFVEIINQSKSEKIAVVLGARHMADLEEQLKAAGHEVAKFPEIEATLPNNGQL